VFADAYGRGELIQRFELRLTGDLKIVRHLGRVYHPELLRFR
jgi:hypothetical protein